MIDDLTDDAFLVGVNTGRISAKCSQCRYFLTPEEHSLDECPRCGSLKDNGDHPHVQYMLVS